MEVGLRLDPAPIGSTRSGDGLLLELLEQVNLRFTHVVVGVGGLESDSARVDLAIG